MISKQIKQIKRITRYETLMNKAEQLIKKYSKDDADELCEIMKELESYYLSDVVPEFGAYSRQIQDLMFDRAHKTVS